MNSFLERAKQLDQEDELNKYREQFYIEPTTIYFDGNSLGLMSKNAEKAMLNMMTSWKEYGIDGWTSGDHPWFTLSEKLGAMSAHLVGAQANEVLVTGSTTINLHQILATFYQPAGSRTKILADELNFPTDIYAMQSQLALHGYDPAEHLVQVESSDGQTLCEDDIIAAMTDEIALIILPSVLYRSGQILNMKKLTAAAHERSIQIGFDLCHSIGAIPHDFDEWGVDFAFWCTYKHLNGGPGAVGGMYVNKKHFGTVPGMTGWFGSKKEKQFDMDHTMTMADDIGAYQLGTPHVLSLAPLIGSLEMFEEVGMQRIRKKSLALTSFMMELITQELAAYDFVIANPKDDAVRGAHIYLEHPEAARICKALKANKVIPDFRAPQGIRLAPVALYNTFEEVYKTVMILKEIMVEEQYKKYSNERDVVA